MADFRTINYGAFDETETMYMAHDQFNRRILIKKELLPYHEDYWTKEQELRFPFYCEVSTDSNGEPVAHRCFKYSYDALEYANMEIVALQWELHELTEKLNNNLNN